MNFSDKELPTISVAIPARNETEDLKKCLDSILNNNYPKFEILVLDDCSRDKTPEIIKEYAKSGVRFIKGEEPSDNWLAKNQAYDRLATEASGELILFCGVDVRFGPDTIRALVTTMLNRDKDMISVMPQRINSHFRESIIQPMRYWWELALPRRMFNRPPVLSTCWVIKKKVLKKLGGFESVHRSIIPEGFFAREVIKNDGYSFIRSDGLLSVATTKGTAAQYKTAIRTRYPMVKRRLEFVLLLTLLELLLFVAPTALLLTSFWLKNTEILFLSIAIIACFSFTNFLIVMVSDPKNAIRALFSMSIVSVVEIFVGINSMLKYEFDKVLWRERNICLPVMHTIPRLPTIDD